MMNQLNLFTSSSSRADQMFEKFSKYFSDNPQIWNLFIQFALVVAESGRTHYSARAIFHRIRWHVEIETKSEDSFKIGNNHSPYFARLFHLVYPEYNGLFRNRELTSASKPASINDCLFIGKPPDLTEEKELDLKLVELFNGLEEASITKT